mmetsp:Transcript_47068/g.147362  ORF Transcript_47068/g.147362 Transcript_47068/m.147362 type:complete len:241 (+) Transcript_47068:3-725(+)
MLPGSGSSQPRRPQSPGGFNLFPASALMVNLPLPVHPRASLCSDMPGPSLLPLRPLLPHSSSQPGSPHGSHAPWRTRRALPSFYPWRAGVAHQPHKTSRTSGTRLPLSPRNPRRTFRARQASGSDHTAPSIPPVNARNSLRSRQPRHLVEEPDLPPQPCVLPDEILKLALELSQLLTDGVSGIRVLLFHGVKSVGEHDQVLVILAIQLLYLLQRLLRDRVLLLALPLLLLARFAFPRAQL